MCGCFVGFGVFVACGFLLKARARSCVKVRPDAFSSTRAAVVKGAGREQSRAQANIVWQNALSSAPPLCDRDDVDAGRDVDADETATRSTENRMRDASAASTNATPAAAAAASATTATSKRCRTDEQANGNCAENGWPIPGQQQLDGMVGVRCGFAGFVANG